MTYQTGSDVPTAMIAGDVAVATGTWVNPMQVASYDVGAKILAQPGDPAGTMSLIAAPDSGIKSVTDIAGKTITLTNAAVVVRTLKNICDKYGIDYDGLNIVNTAPSDGVAAYLNGDVDALFTWQPFGAMGLINGGGTEIINGMYDYSNGKETPVSDIYISRCVFYVSEKFAAQNPNTCAKLVWAIAKATLDLQDDAKIDELAELTAEDMGTTPEIAAANMRAMKYSMEMTTIGSRVDEEVPIP